MTDKIKVGTKDEAMWTDVKDATIKRIENLEINLKIDNEILKMAKNKILLEQRK